MKINSCVPLSPTSSFPKLFSSSLKSHSNLPLYHTFFFHDPPNTGLFLDYLPAVTHAEVYKILTFVPPKSSSADLIKSCPGVFSELISVFTNHSFSESCFPTLFKNAVLVPLLKKPSLDKSVCSV